MNSGNDESARVDAVDGAYSFEVDPQGVGLFTIARAAKLNALTVPVLDGIAAALAYAESSSLHLLVFTGDGEKAFCAGTDLGELQGMQKLARLAKNARARNLMVTISRSPVLSIAALNGLAYGGGLELAMACHFRIAAAHARLSLPEIKLGLLPAYGGTQFLPALVGKSLALEMMLSGRALLAEEALRSGLIHRVAEDGNPFLQSALAFAHEIAAHSRPAREAIRACVAMAGESVGDVGLAFEDEQMRAVFETEDAGEGVKAFLEKRAPVYKHQ